MKYRIEFYDGLFVVFSGNTTLDQIQTYVKIHGRIVRVERVTTTPVCIVNDHRSERYL